MSEEREALATWFRANTPVTWIRAKELADMLEAAGWRRSPPPDPRVAEIRARLEAAQAPIPGHDCISDAENGCFCNHPSHAVKLQAVARELTRRISVDCQAPYCGCKDNLCGVSDNYIAAALAAAREAAEQRERALREALEAIEEGAPDGATARLARAALEASR